MNAHAPLPPADVPVVPPAPEPFADGLYFGLDEERYHADPALGSTDVKRLRTSGPDYWWFSALNPNRPPHEAKPHQTFGRAVHKLVLEGVEPFTRVYQRADDGAEVLRTAEDLAGWLKAHGETKVPRAKAAMIEAIQACVRELAALDESVAMPKIEEVILREAEEAGREILKADAYDRILGAAAAIAENEGLATAFQNGQPEVSLFWTEDVEGFPVRCKARFDYLKPRGIGDLKSIRNSRSVDFVEACRRAIAEYRYDLQAAHYLRGRSRLPDLVAGGAVYGASPEVLAWLVEHVVPAEAPAFQWIFYQSEGAPNVKSYVLSAENPIAIHIAGIEVAAALRKFVELSRAYPPGRPWRLTSPPEELHLEDLPAWYGRT
jgi:hypothetical protein